MRFQRGASNPSSRWRRRKYRSGVVQTSGRPLCRLLHLCSRAGSHSPSLFQPLPRCVLRRARVSGVKRSATLPEALYGRSPVMRFAVRISWWLVLLCLVFLITAAVWITPQWSVSRSCQPTFWEVAEGRSIDVHVGSRQFGIKAVLIGCEADLQRTIDPGRQEQIVSVIEEMLRTETWQAWPKSKEKDFRLAVAEQINALLERPAVCDVCIDSFSAAE